MKKIIVTAISFILLLGFYTPSANAAEYNSGFCDQYKGVKSIWWDGIELKSGQIGRLIILKDTPLYKLEGEKRIFSRTLKKGEFYRIYAFKPGKLSVGGGYYVDRDPKVKYETPSKAKLQAVQCINGTYEPPTTKPSEPKPPIEEPKPSEEKYTLLEINKPYVSIDNGMTVTIENITSVDKGGFVEYTITYHEENKTSDKVIVQGSFKIYYKDGKSEPQSGFFNKLYPGEKTTRSYTFKALKSQELLLVEYGADIFFNQKPSQQTLKWGIELTE
ncbi:hypothetical protein ACFRCQ_22050 [Cytobacillus firmus]|uniref:hypothetical protein n=1 Tax=Cytobacillus firmus TaxID=1399 RepID=UPI0036769D86